MQRLPRYFIEFVRPIGAHTRTAISDAVNSAYFGVELRWAENNHETPHAVVYALDNLVANEEAIIEDVVQELRRRNIHELADFNVIEDKNDNS